MKCRWLAWALVGFLLAGKACFAAEGRTGEQVYRQMCAKCHGTAGEGAADKYPDPLVGNKSAPQLARYITKSMPEDKPGTCTGPDADKVAAYIYDAFYSKAAQAKNQPPRVELSRLTVRQYRHAVADLIGTFRAPGRWDGSHGLRGEYSKSRRFRTFDRVLDRVDPEINFDFGTGTPDPRKIEGPDFSIRWSGAVLAPETGTYEFIVRTEHAMRLWVNDINKPLIDALVRSGSDNEHRATLFLLGGRVYPLRLEFSKAKQGVDDSKKVKPKPVKASLALLWKLPQRAEEVIPARQLSPRAFSETFVVTTRFPPDDRSVGYERGTSVSKAWDTATTDAAIETAGYVVNHLGELSGVGDGATDRAKKLREFCGRFAERAFCRPLSPEHRQLYVDRQFQEAPDTDAAVKRSVMLVLKSPRFLYREFGALVPRRADAATLAIPRVDAATLAIPRRADAATLAIPRVDAATLAIPRVDAATVAAARLSFGLWDSLPDKDLLQAAAKGELVTREQVTRQAERIVSDLRTRAKLREFLLQWLKVEQVADNSKDPKEFLGFNEALTSDLRTSLDMFLEDALWSEKSDFRELLLADTLFLNGRLARFYGAGLPIDAPFQKISLSPLSERAGILTHPYLMATFAYTAASSPIHRGVFLARSVLGQSLRPPPDAAVPLPAELHPRLTTRERVDLQTRPQACQTCHGLINPLGFTLEHFDAVGRYRDDEKGKPIDSTGAYQTRAGEIVKFVGVRDLATFLAGSTETHEAFVEQLFHYLVKQPVRAFGPRKPADLRKYFVDNQYNVRKLMVEMVVESALGPDKRLTADRRRQEH